MARLRNILAILVTAVALTAIAADYGTAARKAARFFEFEEWASASAMYELMLSERPNDINTYASAIVAAYENADTTKALDLFTRAQRNLIPFDSLLSETRRVSFSIGDTRLYEDFLLRIQANNPDIARPIDNYLLQYYSYRHDNNNVVTYTEKLASSAPNKREFLLSQIDGLINVGNFSQARDVAKSIIDENPDDFDALVALGVVSSHLMNETADKNEAADFRLEAMAAFNLAYLIHPTPKIKQYLNDLANF